MKRVTLAITATFTLSLTSALSAQDFGSSWIDRVTHELIEDDGPLSPHPLELKASAGELYTFDSNVFLTHNNRTSDSILITFANASLKFAQPNFDVEADLTINYNAYIHESDSDADEERFYGRARYQGSKVTLQLAEIIRRESSPTDATFTTRVSRCLSNTSPLVVVKLTEVFAIELQSDLQFVKYLRQNFDTADNFNSRTILTLAYTTDWNKMELLVQGGYLTIDYHDPFSPPDSTGFLARGGVRGEISPNLHVIALMGFTSAKSDDFAGSTTGAKMNTADVEIHVAYNPTETFTGYADYSRRFGFSADGAPFQVVDAADLIAECSLRDDLKIRGRLQYDRVHSVLGLRRAYYSFGVGSEWKVHPHIVLDAGLTYRWGVVPGSNGAGNFGDAILSIGGAVVF
jgi:hypothetical protein